MKTVRFKITGLSPLLMCNPAAMLEKDSAGLTRSKQEYNDEEEAQQRAYVLKNKQLYIKAEALRSSLVDGGKGRKVGKYFASSLLQGTVFATVVECPLTYPSNGKPITDYEIDRRRVVVNKGGIIRSRPKINDWSTVIEFEYDPDDISVRNILEAFQIAGRRVGVGDYRPGKSNLAKGGGPFGRYTVEVLIDA